MVYPSQQDKNERCPNCKEWKTCRVCDMTDNSVTDKTDLRCYNCKGYEIHDIAMYIGHKICSSGDGWESGMMGAVDRAIEETKRHLSTLQKAKEHNNSFTENPKKVSPKLNQICKCGHDWNFHDTLSGGACHEMECKCNKFNPTS